jgi:hypothetical protein
MVVVLVDLQGTLGTCRWLMMLSEEKGHDGWGRRSLLPTDVPARRKERVLGISIIIVERRGKTRKRLGLFMIQRGGQSLERKKCG